MQKIRRLAGVCLILLLWNSVYLGLWATASIFYMANVLVHIVLGAVLAALYVLLIVRDEDFRRSAWIATVFFALSTLLAAYLIVEYNLTAHRWALLGHIGAAAVGTASLGIFLRRQARLQGGGWKTIHRAFSGSLVLLGLGTSVVSVIPGAIPQAIGRIRNSARVPASMEEEGAGPSTPFFPSPTRTTSGKMIPADYFMEPEACGECHKDIYEQWNSSAHHFASFNNQFYRKSVEYMQEAVGVRPSKWCAGCHDHALLFSGMFERPAREYLDAPEARAGLSCVSCHSIAHVGGSGGNGDFVFEYPELHDIAASKNPVVRRLDRFLTFMEPEPHRRIFMKPFMRADASEFCSSCHKVHLDVPVNAYRWVRGFNEYDAWQASGVSGQGARSFYYPSQSSTCADCHMPLVESADPGNHGGKVHSHRFPGANTALAYVNHDAEQMRVTQDFLRSGFITVDIFAMSPVDASMLSRISARPSAHSPQLMSSFAVGEEAEPSGDAFIREVGKVAAPLEKAGAVLVPGSTVRVDVVVRTRKIGHFFPGGTVDAFDVWLEFQAKDAVGKIIIWSGAVENGGTGPVEPGAHFYRSFQLDGDGNPINKRNAFQTRSLLYVRLIPPGAADVAHFLMQVPPDSRGPITLTAKLNYRKFSHYYTRFAYAGKVKPGQDASLLGPGHNSLEYTFDAADIPRNVSGKIKDRIPDLPIVTLAQDELELDVGGAGRWVPKLDQADYERWNDWGIGMLLQGDLKGSIYAFGKVTEAAPAWPDGWLNVARAMIQEGETGAARPYIEKALHLNPGLARTHFFNAQIQKADGDYDAALASLRRVVEAYPRDRVALNQTARLLFLKREYAGALDVLKRVCDVDPEDLQMHYTAMLCYRGLGDSISADREEKLFLRFKAEEASQAITLTRRLIKPEDNNERLQIHDHYGVSPAEIAASHPTRERR